MELRLDDDFKIESDGIQYILYRRRRPKDKTKDDYWTAESYTNDLRQALNSYARIAKKEAFRDSADIKELMKLLDDIEKTIRTAKWNDFKEKIEGKNTDVDDKWGETVE